ncbi:helix-turn-helix transcriptional regulator [Actinokineospora sp. UTMC 2448]|uniref:helix-turn-helix domain-containing protein n=1 Tax=Actinokineospora sp. UTMC 2448 TaxID=2268449 RepID=UPI00216447FE|nr:helix-turn-helix transcriptional regulator [Actinokineospora sp. UTMC 2448]UVS81219.1 Helix-turn-helix domain protein [Actinokineospora sp. UTMC 2448]
MSEAGDLLRVLRERKGYSLTRLAREANYNKGYLSKIENGERPLGADKARHLDRILETDGVLVRAVTPRPPEPEPLPDTDDGPWSLVLEPTGRVRYAPAGHDGAGATTFAPNSYVVDDDTLALFEAQFEHLRMVGHRASPAFVLPDLVTNFTKLRALLRVEAAPELIRLAYRFAEYAGWMFQEAGKTDMAHGWTTKAVGMAARVGDAGLAGYALVRASEIALYDGDGYTMVDLARRAAAAPDATAAVRSLAAQREAQGHALVGDLTACLSALDAAERWEEEAAAESGPHFGTTSLPNPIAIARGWSMHSLARNDESAELLTAELARIPTGSVRSRVRFGVRLALTNAERGDIEGACTQVAAMLRDLKRTDSATVRVDLRSLVGVLAKHNTNPMVRDLRPELGELLRVRR